MQIASGITGLEYVDTGLQPDTTYSYGVEALNVVGTAQSVSIPVTTLEGAPEGISQPALASTNQSTVVATWVEPNVTNGVVIEYRIVLVAVNGVPLVDFETAVVTSGETFAATVMGLSPFTTYSFVLMACTSQACGSSQPTDVLTAQAPPTFQPAPRVDVVSATALNVSWYPPPMPNGVVSHYEVWQRFPVLTGSASLVAAVPANASTSVVVYDLQPFSSYEFSVTSFTLGGSTRSNWTVGMTAEAGWCMSFK